MRHFVLYTNVKNYDRIYLYYEKQNKGDYIMGKVKQWAEDVAEKEVELILSTFFSAVSSAHCFTFDIM